MSDTGRPTWQRVTFLKPGAVYMQGNITQFIGLTKWRGASVMYIGDHVYSDLAVCTLLFFGLLFLTILFSLGSYSSTGLEDMCCHS